MEVTEGGRLYFKFTGDSVPQSHLPFVPSPTKHKMGWEEWNVSVRQEVGPVVVSKPDISTADGEVFPDMVGTITNEVVLPA